jgi:hypothetical protein
MKALSCALLVAVLGATVSAREIKDCLNWHPAVSLSTYVPPDDVPGVTGRLLPRLADGTQVAWTDPRAKRFGIVCAGMSNMRQVCSKLVPYLKDRLGHTGEITFVTVAENSAGTEKWADPGNTVWDDAAAHIAAAGLSPRQVLVWIQMHAIRDWSVHPTCTMRASEVQAVMANARALYPNIALWPVADLNWTGASWNVDRYGNLTPGGVACGEPYPAGTLLRHPPMKEVSRNGFVLESLARTQSGVPGGSYLLFDRVATNGPGTGGSETGFFDIDCQAHLKDDGVHLTTGTGVLSGAYAVAHSWGDRILLWHPLRAAFPWLQ